MEYPTVFIDSTIQKQFNIWAYPTLYLIDGRGKVAYSKKGYGKNTEKEIDSILTGLLNK